MSPTMKRTLWALLLVPGVALSLFAPPARAQEALEQDPGYVDVRLVEEGLGRPASIEVNIRGALLRLVASASEHEDPDLARLLRRLKAIQVRGFPLASAEDARAAERNADRLGRRLEGHGWDAVMRVRDAGERVDMYVRTRDDDAIAGLVVFVVDTNDDESVFINIVGEIDPEEIGRIGRTFNIGSLDGVADDAH